MAVVQTAAGSTASEERVNTFLFTDIQGSTRLWEEHPEAMRPALARHDAILRSAIERHGGHVFKTIGDAFCAAFGRAEDAVAAAAQAQEVLQDGAWENGGPLKVRMALHTGPAEYRDGDYFGPALNRAARLLAAAHGGQIVLTQSTRQALGGRLSPTLGLRFLGRHRLKDLPMQDEVFQVQAPALRADFPPLNTLELAYRRGLVRASAVAAVVLLVISALAVTATNNARRARRAAISLRRSLYTAQVNLAAQSLETGGFSYARELLEAQVPRPGQEDLRDFVWRHLWWRTRDASRRTVFLASPAVKIAFSPDGRLLATSYPYRGVTTLRDAATGKERFTLGRRGEFIPVTDLAFSPDGRMVATAGRNGAALWDVSTGKPLWASPVPMDGLCVAFSPDGRILAVGGQTARRGRGPRAGEVRLLETATRRTRARLPLERAAYHIALSPDGKTLAVAGGSMRALLDVASGRRLRLFLANSHEGVVSLAFSPDGQTLAAGGTESVQLFSVATGRQQHVFQGHHGGIYCLAFSPDGRTLASGSLDQTIRLWDPRAGKPVSVLLGHRYSVTAVAFSPDGKTLVSGSDDRTLKFWDPAPERDVLTGHAGFVKDVAFSPDSRTLASASITTAGSRAGSARLWVVGSWQPSAPILSGTRLDSVAFSPDGKSLAAGVAGAVILRDAASGTTRRLREMAHRTVRVAFSPDGKTLAATEGRRIRFLDAKTGAPIAAVGGYTDDIPQMVFSPDGRLLAFAGFPDPVFLWDTAAQSLKRRLQAPPDGATAFAFSPDGRTVAAGYFDSAVRLFDVRGERPAVLLRGHSDFVYGVAFSPDGKTLATASADDTVRLWNTVTGREVAAYRHAEDCFSVAFSPDGQWLAAGVGNQVRLWRAAPMP